MNKTLPEIIKKNRRIRQTLHKQNGGIVKYLADNLYAKSVEELIKDYQKYQVKQIYENKKWNLKKKKKKDELQRDALGKREHLLKELQYQLDMRPLLTEMPQDISNAIVQFNELYLTYAYKQDLLRWYPEGVTDRAVYHEVIEMYGISGIATKCMQIILAEHNATGMYFKREDILWTEFLIRQRVKLLTLGVFAKMRNAVAEMLKGKDKYQCRQMAIDTMKRVRGFSQMIYSDVVVQSLRDINYTVEANKRERDGKWLRDVADNIKYEEYIRKISGYSMPYCFAIFVDLLKDVGRIWAAQLLARGIDMHELEDGVACIMSPADNPNYYVDRYYTNDLPDKYCVADIETAEHMLNELGRELQSECYMEIVKESMESEVQNKLSKAYIVLTEEGFIDGKGIKQDEFIDILLHNKNSKIIWKNDKTHKFLKTFIKVLLGIDKKYPHDAILKPSQKGKQWDFVERHFVDEKAKPIIIKANSTELGMKDKQQFERILKAVYGTIMPRKQI